MTLLFGILDQNKTEEPLHYRVTYGGTAPVVTALEAYEMRIEEIRRVLNRNNVPTTTDVDPTPAWARAFHAMPRGEVTDVRRERQIDDVRDVYATMTTYAEPEANQAIGG